MKAIAILALVGAAFAAPNEDCASARVTADAYAGNCDILRYCKGLSANAGFGANAGASNNEGFVGNAAMAPSGEFNDGFNGNAGASNGGILANDGAFSNDGFLANAPSAEGNDGSVSNDGFSNDGFSNDGMANDGAMDANMAMAPSAESNDAFSANIDADTCALLDSCGVFDSEEFIKCTVDSEPPKCNELYIGDGVCDAACDVPEHDNDGGDCL